jgi:hypothetical protein
MVLVQKSALGTLAPQKPWMLGVTYGHREEMPCGPSALGEAQSTFSGRRHEHHFSLIVSDGCSSVMELMAGALFS